MPKTAWKDEYTLLCEKCGYVIEGLDTSGNCPECGKPIAESLPERRVGTPWQRSPGVKSLLATWWMTLRHPLRTLDVMRFDDESKRSLLTATSACSFVLVSVGAFGFMTAIGSIEQGRLGAGTLITLLIVAPMLALICVGMYALLTLIEARGLRVIGRARGFRVSKRIARSIVAHGCVGWTIVSLSLCVASTVQGIHMLASSSASTTPPASILLIGLPLLVAITGFLFFETFAYLGLRRLKYANRVRPESPSQGATTRVEDAQ